MRIVIGKKGKSRRARRELSQPLAATGNADCISPNEAGHGSGWTMGVPKSKNYDF